MVDSMVFISVVVLAVVQILKMAFPQIAGWLTIIVAFIVGIVAAIFSVQLGLGSISIAQGVLTALGSIGIASTAKKAASGQ